MSFKKFSSIIKRQIALVMPVVIVFGLFFGYYFDLTFLNCLSVPISLLIVYPLMVSLPISSLKKWTGSWVLVVFILLNVVLVPLIGYSVGFMFFEFGSPMFLGLFFVALLPTSGSMTITWTDLGRGNVIFSAQMTIMGLLFGALGAPFYLQFLVGKSVDVQLLDIIEQIVKILILPFIFGQVTRLFYINQNSKKSFDKKIKPNLSYFSLWALLALIFVAMVLKAKLILNNVSIIIQTVPPLIIFYFLCFIASGIVARATLNRTDGVAVIYCTSLRSLSVALVLSINMFPNTGELAVLIAVAYLIQIQFAALSKKIIQVLYNF